MENVNIENFVKNNRTKYYKCPPNHILLTHDDNSTECINIDKLMWHKHWLVPK